MVWGVTLMDKTWKNHVSHLPVGQEIIQQLLLPNQLMMIAGQYGIGKTSELLHLMCAFSYGGLWHGLKVEPTCPLYITWEGDPRKLDNRIHKIEPQYESLGKKYPWYIRLEPKRMPLNLPTGSEKLSQIVNELDPRPSVILLDPFKRTVSSNYIKPDIADAWIHSVSSLARELKCSIITSNHTNKIVHKTSDSPDALGSDKVKGAGDLMDGVSTAILFAEEKGYKRITLPNGYSKVEWISMGVVIKVLKSRDSTAEFPLLRVHLDRDELKLRGEKWQVDDTNEVVSAVEES